MQHLIDSDPIYALATPYESSAIAVFRVSGDTSLVKLNGILTKPIALKKEGKGLFYRTLAYKNIKIDDCLISVFSKGHGYTREEAAEIQVHGSLAVIDLLDEVLNKIGFRKAERGEFSYRAVRNGSLSLSEAENVLSLINAKSESQREAAYKNLNGELDARLEGIKKSLIEIASLYELQLDYAEDEYQENISFPKEKLEAIKKDILSLIKSYDISKKREDGLKLVLFGKTNEGKSSLFNILLRHNRAIVSSRAGTTRDYIREEVVLAGERVFLYDTAGLNENSEELEDIGIGKSLELAKEADIVICFVSGDDNYDVEIKKLEKSKKHIIKVSNKSDLEKNKDIKKISDSSDVIAISCKTMEGIDSLIAILIKEIKKCLKLSSKTRNSEVYITSSRQKINLEEVLGFLNKINAKSDLEIASFLLRSAINKLNETIGRKAEDLSQEILDSVFSNFCVGK